MELTFALALTEHRLLGFVFAPYLIKPEQKKNFYAIHDRVTLQNIQQYKPILSAEQQQLVRTIEDYNDQNLARVFSKKKKTAREFISSIDEVLLKEQIRPYVERRMSKCIDILRYSPEPVYHKFLQNNIYESDRIELIQEDCQAVFNFERNAEGIKYRLSIEYNEHEISLIDQEGIIVVNEPCCLCLGNEMLVFRGIDGKKLLPFFEKEFVSVGKASEEKYLDVFVRNAIKKYKVNATGFRIEDIQAEPKPILSLEQNLKGILVLVLKFVYGQESIYQANRETEMKVQFKYAPDQEVVFQRLKRDYEAENEYITKLLSFGLSNEDGPFFSPFRKKQDESYHSNLLINWLNFNGEVLRNAGFDLSQNKLEKAYYLENFEMKMEVSENENDWFDIMATVEFAGFKIPFSAFRDHIVGGNPEYLLPDGRVMILPEEWFESYKDIVQFSKEESGRFKLKKQHFALLDKKGSKLAGSLKGNLKGLVQASKELVEVPQGIDAELRSYQVAGFSWMYQLYKNGFGACLADDMGLGKTLQTLTLLKKVGLEHIETAPEKKTEHQKGQLDLFSQGDISNTSSSKTSLIVVPTSLVHNWMNEIKKFVPQLKALAHAGSSRAKLEDVVGKYDIIVTSYGVLRNELEAFVKYEFLYLVLDESQMVKNPGSKTYQSVLQLVSDYRLVLTGTPIENSLTDLWAQLNFLNRGLLGNMSFFRSEFQTPIEKRQDENKRQRLQKLIAPFILRRSKMEVAKELPPIAEQVIPCDLNEIQENYYEREKSKARNLVLESIEKYGYNKSAIMILQSLTRLRQIANHPGLVDEDYLAGSGKYEEIIRRLENLQAEGNKALIFSSFVKHLDLVADYLQSKGIKFAKITGETQKREQQIEQFQNQDDTPFFLISLKAGGVGLNLTAADYVLILDPWWNPAAEQQAIARAHRIGQTKQVMVYRFIAQGTLEEKILKLQEKKSELANAFVNDNALKDVSEEEVMELFA